MIAQAPCQNEVSGRTDRGLKRRNNEDYFLTANLSTKCRVEQAANMRVSQAATRQEEFGRILLVADGMGGQAGGGEASTLAAEVFLEGFLKRAGQALQQGRSLRKEMKAILSSCLFASHRSVLRAGHADPRLFGMGTTLTAAIVQGTQLFIAHVGDSRCYLLRDSVLTQLTRDHTFLQWCADHNTAMPDDSSRLGHILWNAIGGQSAGLVPEVTQTAIIPGDILLLCTDGLTGQVSDEAIAAILGGEHLKSATLELIEEANRAGGCDNVTVLAARIGAELQAENAERADSDCSAGCR